MLISKELKGSAAYRPAEMACGNGHGFALASAIARSTVTVARLLVFGLCVDLCQKGLGVTFKDVENLLLDMPVVLLAPTL